MKLPRRTFLKTSVAASAAALATHGSAATSGTGAGREYYDLRAYRLKPGAPRTSLDLYLEKAFLPALDRRGIKNVGVFTELDVNKTNATSAPKPDAPVWVLIPYSTLDAFVGVSSELNNDPAVRQGGAEYLDAKKANPAFERIDSWLYYAFKGMPRMEIPAFSRNRTPTRVFEMRDYESHSELRALAKIAMFEEGEMAVMRDLGMSPVFFGQGLAGPNLPHLRYFTSGPDLAAHLNNWKKFGPDPRWAKMKDLPQYVDATSKNTARFLAPTAYSQL
jgi:hypothetical protein